MTPSANPSPKNRKTLKQKAERFYQQGVEELQAARLDSARASLDQVLLVYNQLSDHAGMALGLLKLGRVLELLGQYDRAQETYKGSRDLYEGLNDPLGIARAKAFLGNVGWAKGDYAGASRRLEESLHTFRAAGDKPGSAWVLDMLANLHLAQGKHHEAEKLHRDAYELAREIGENPEGQAWNHYHLAAIDLFRGHGEAAQAGFLSALNLFTGLGDVLGQVAVCTHLGEIACGQKNLAEAERYILQALRLVVPTHCKPLLTDALTSLVRLLKARGEESKAMGILMVVLSHPTCRQQTKDRMVTLSKELQANFSSKELESGFRWAKEFTIEEMAKAWIKVLSPKPLEHSPAKTPKPKKKGKAS
jgi:ATP/maltotriose-dependent transcriptional regulator MalT